MPVAACAVAVPAPQQLRGAAGVLPRPAALPDVHSSTSYTLPLPTPDALAALCLMCWPPRLFCMLPPGLAFCPGRNMYPQGPVFDTDARRAHGPVLRWVDRLLRAPPLGISQGMVPAVPKDVVGRSALFNLLRSNLEMFSVCVDRCYDRDPHIATGSFQVRVCVCV